MSSAEELAQEFETGEMVSELGGGSKGKRSKAEQAEHKHPHPEGATRKTVDNWVHGEENRKDAQVQQTEKASSKTGGSKSAGNEQTKGK